MLARLRSNPGQLSTLVSRAGLVGSRVCGFVQWSLELGLAWAFPAGDGAGFSGSFPYGHAYVLAFCMRMQNINYSIP